MRKEFSTRTKALLWECFEYSQATGHLTWRVRPRHHFATESAWKGINSREAGKPVDHITAQGYLAFRLNRMVWLAHRAVWIMHDGEIPEGMMIDHVNRRKADNRLANLRLATKGQNLMNSTRRSGRLLPKGVYLDASRGKYMAAVGHEGRLHNCGRYDTIEEALEASWARRQKLHGDFATLGNDE